MYAIDFEFDGQKLSDYGMIICSFNSNLETVSSGADITFHQSNSSCGNRFHLYASTYDSAYSSTFQICKNPGDKLNDGNLSVEEVSALQRWLCRKDKYYRFKVFQDGYEHIYWNATFSSKQIEIGGRAVGLELTLYTDAPYAYRDEIVVSKDCSENLSFHIYDNSDEVGFIYPNLTITLLEDGEGEDRVFTLKNSLDHKTTRINGCTSGECIEIDGKNQIIRTSCLTHTSLAKDFNYFFPKIINTYTDNDNIFTCNLKCEIKIS
ncbi:MAG: hypothetical protein NC124_18135, partial [Clostridium sp.]|nr:hypothetical protein [Clostridium sp.]